VFYVLFVALPFSEIANQLSVATGLSCSYCRL
jgi:hypothetical protein